MSMLYRIVVSGTWAGRSGVWIPAIAGTVNGTGQADEDASTFASEEEAQAAIDSLGELLADAPNLEIIATSDGNDGAEL